MTHNPIATNITWGGNRTDIPGLTNIASESDLTDIQASCNNTDIITAYGDSSTYQPAWVAKNYKPSGTPNGKSWCLPSGGLLKTALDSSDNFTKFNNAILEIKSEAGTKAATILGAVDYGVEHIWSSSEISSTGAWVFYATTSGSFSMFDSAKTNDFSVRPVMEF